MRALTKIPLNASPSERREGLEENMTLVTESTRAIGCRVTDDTGEKILAKDPQTIKDFLVDLIRVRATADSPLEGFAASGTAAHGLCSLTFG